MKLLHLLETADTKAELQVGDYIIHVGRANDFPIHHGCVGRITHLLQQHNYTGIMEYRIDWLNYIPMHLKISTFTKYNLAKVQPTEEDLALLALMYL